MNTTADFTRLAAALVRANDDHAEDFALWTVELTVGRVR